MDKIELKHIFIFQTIAASLFGLGFMIMPAFIMTLLGLSVEADGPLSMRFFWNYDNWNGNFSILYS